VRELTAVISRILVLALVLTAGLGPAPAAAQFYRWIDERGVPHYAEGLDSVPERYRASATPLGLRNAPTPAAPPVVEPPGRTVPRGGSVIRYAPGERIMVDVKINGTSTARLVLDTGADGTLISPRALRAAGVSLVTPIGTGQVIGVTGSDRVPFVMVESLQVGDARVVKLPVGAYEIAQAEGDGLLGRDFLNRFNVTIDAVRGLVTLSPK
jgi:hypothetical protein